ncbi:calcium/sodium antiporter [soil metagenome]
MIWTLLILIAGLALLIAGADVLVRGVSGLAASLGVPPLVIGLTVVAFGTSLPELVINTMSAAKGQTELAFGNLVGACTLNIGFVLAITALVRPIEVHASIITREIPMMLLGVAGIVVLTLDRELGGVTNAIDMLSRTDGMMLLLLFGVFLYYTIMQSFQKRKTDPFVTEVKDLIDESKSAMPAAQTASRATWVDVLMVLAGVGAVTFGGRLTVGSAVSLAIAWGISQAVIGLTILSFGTTLPELVTGVVAARRGQGDIAIGNVVGSNIFNLLCIGGIVSCISPIALPQGGRLDLLMMAALCTLLLPLAIRGPRRITRAEGALLLIATVAYTIYRTAFAAGS